MVYWKLFYRVQKGDLTTVVLLDMGFFWTDKYSREDTLSVLKKNSSTVDWYKFIQIAETGIFSKQSSEFFFHTAGDIIDNLMTFWLLTYQSFDHGFTFYITCVVLFIYKTNERKISYI